jgi:uncharacterized protein YdeI (YjbR/CyaY-like superfamily)
MKSEVDGFLGGEKRWKEEFTKLRRIILACELEEELKWGQPCYSLGGKNVVLMHGFKEYCALLFMKGALMKDPKGILIQQTANVQAGRQIRFANALEIDKLEKTLKAYIREAIEVEKAGLKVEMKKTSDYDMSEEFRIRLDAQSALKAAFEALTPGRQRAYLYYFSQAKQSATRASRVEKCIPRILDGLGLDD